MDQDEERRIIAQVCAGDANAFEALVVAYQKQVYNLALRTVGNEEDAADMTQEVFLRLSGAGHLPRREQVLRLALPADDERVHRLSAQPPAAPDRVAHGGGRG